MKYEVLSPVGDLNNFYVAIDSGADAVYLGLNKFNARMKADNISLENICSVVDYAHLKNVKVYVTLNTLVSTTEMKEVVSMVGECLKAGVDAFIVQDYGIIGVLRSVYPNIVLHGSTQLGVHNVRGARVAKKLGLSRVVLSREVTLEDIKQIKQNVDIELEVFVQGANCVCFSGNCYLSSLKFGASGNRGECKQLCRLPYSLSSNQQSISGYAISPRDNCMISRLKELMDIGVVSFKIEGRLRRKGYVNIATRTYRNAIDNILNNMPNDEDKMKGDLTKVFARGEFAEGYFNGNNIIDIKNNNHKGIHIGKVIACSRFKDIYRIEISSKQAINSGDGLKLISDSDIYTLGVGNVEHIGNKYVIFGKNHIPVGSEVYRVLDEKFENEIIDKSYYRDLKISVTARIGRPLQITMQSGEYSYSASGVVCENAKSREITEDNFKDQLNKLSDMKSVFKISNISLDIDSGLFVPLGEINNLRRECLTGLTKTILEDNKLPFEKNELEKPSFTEARFQHLAVVDERCDIDSLSRKYDALVLSPSIYSIEVISEFNNRYKKYFENNLILNMPIIAMHRDCVVLDKIVDYCKQAGIILLANNIYALDYIEQGLTVWAGSNMNVCNEYACDTLNMLGVKEIVSSIEKWCGGISGTYRMCKGKRVLMTFAHCPHKTLTHKDCERLSGCGFGGDLKLKSDTQEYTIRRYRVASCYFELVDSVIENKTAEHSIDDLRGL